jgi:hypothetical protein
VAERELFRAECQIRQALCWLCIYLKRATLFRCDRRFGSECRKDIERYGVVNRTVNVKGKQQSSAIAQIYGPTFIFSSVSGTKDKIFSIRIFWIFDITPQHLVLHLDFIAPTPTWRTIHVVQQEDQREK